MGGGGMRCASAEGVPQGAAGHIRLRRPAAQTRRSLVGRTGPVRGGNPTKFLKGPASLLHGEQGRWSPTIPLNSLVLPP